MPRPETVVRVSDDPALIAAVRAAARRTAEAVGLCAVEQIEAGGYVHYKAWDTLKEKPGEAWTALRAILDDPAATPAGKANAAVRLREFGDPAGEAHLMAALSDPSAEVRPAAAHQLWQGGGDEIDMTAPDRRAVLLDLIDDPDPDAARNALLAALKWRQLPGAADRVATRVAAGTAPDVREWASTLAGQAETAGHVAVALPHLFPPDDKEFAYPWYTSDLRRPLTHPDPAVREPIRRGLLDYCLRFSGRRHEQGYVGTLAAVADENTIPLLEQLIAASRDSIAQEWMVGVIARIRPAEAVDRILAHAERVGRLPNPELLAEHVSPADTDRVLAAITPKLLGSDEYTQEHTIRLCLMKLGEGGRRLVQKSLPKLGKSNRAVAVWGLQKLTLRDILEAFAGAGLLPLPVDDAVEAARKCEDEDRWQGSFDPTHPRSLRYALFALGVLVSGGGGWGQVPSPHHELIMQFGRHSRGGFAPECAVQIPGEYEPDEDEEDDEDDAAAGPADPDEFDRDGPLRVQFVHAGRVYEFDPENYGDYYDVDAVALAVNRAVADAGRAERFISAFDGDYVFADPARFLPVADQFAVPVDDEAARLLAQKGRKR